MTPKEKLGRIHHPLRRLLITVVLHIVMMISSPGERRGEFSREDVRHIYRRVRQRVLATAVIVTAAFLLTPEEFAIWVTLATVAIMILHPI